MTRRRAAGRCGAAASPGRPSPRPPVRATTRRRCDAPAPLRRRGDRDSRRQPGPSRARRAAARAAVRGRCPDAAAGARRRRRRTGMPWLSVEGRRRRAPRGHGRPPGVARTEASCPPGYCRGAGPPGRRAGPSAGTAVRGRRRDCGCSRLRPTTCRTARCSRSSASAAPVGRTCPAGRPSRSSVRHHRTQPRRRGRARWRVVEPGRRSCRAPAPTRPPRTRRASSAAVR